MRVRSGGVLHTVGRNRLSLDPEGRTIAMAPDGACLVQTASGFQPHHDPNLGMLRYRGREHLVTHATSFVRDGKDFVALLPAEPCIVRKPTFAMDTELAAVDFTREGLFAESAVVELWGEAREVALSCDLAGRQLATLPSREVLDLSTGVPQPYEPALLVAQGPHIRLDLVLSPAEGGLLTLFFAPRTTPGAQRWMRHMRDTEALTSPIGPHATPFLRSGNVIFHNGPEDFRAQATALEQLVARINAAGYRSTLSTDSDGRLYWPGLDALDNAVLNQLHFEFEAYGERFKSAGSNERPALMALFGDFCQLNDRIHACEGALANRAHSLETAWWSLHASFIPDLYEMLTAEMYREFTLDWDFGTLFMGYHTLGKDYMAAFWNGDLDLVRRNEIRPQRISSAEIFGYFGPSVRGEREALRRWWQAHDLESMGHPFDDPANAIGYIPVADLDLLGVAPLDAKRRLKAVTAVAAVSTALL